MKERISDSRFKIANPKGFTLLELLIVVAILGIVISVIAACLSAGIRVWDKARKLNAVETEALVGLDVLEDDLINTFKFYDISFMGEDAHLSFPALIVNLGDYRQTITDSSAPDYSGGRLDSFDNVRLWGRIGSVKYYFDRNERALFRSEWAYPGEEPSERGDRIVANLKSMKLSYLSKSGGNSLAESGSTHWDNKTNFPEVVSVELVFGDLRKDQFRISRTILLPASSAEERHDAAN